MTAPPPRERAQAWLKLQGYEPTALQISAFTRLGARATQANIAFDDHPNHKRFSDRIETVTVDSVFAWLQRSGLGAAPIDSALLPGAAMIDRSMAPAGAHHD